MTYSFTYPCEVVELADQFYESLNTSHRELCPWLNNACSPAFSKFPLQATDTEMKRDICERLNSFNARIEELKYNIPQWVVSLLSTVQYTHALLRRN
jgi:hypothetical protein